MSVIKTCPLSVNLAWQGRRYKTPTYKAYEKEMLWLLPRDITIPDGELKIFIEWGFSSKSSDWDNPIKPFVDILQKKYGFNDNRIYEAKIKKKIVKKGEEYIRFEISAL